MTAKLRAWLMQKKLACNFHRTIGVTAVVLDVLRVFQEIREYRPQPLNLSLQRLKPLRLLVDDAVDADILALEIGVLVAQPGQFVACRFGHGVSLYLLVLWPQTSQVKRFDHEAVDVDLYVPVSHFLQAMNGLQSPQRPSKSHLASRLHRRQISLPSMRSVMSAFQRFAWLFLAYL